MSNGYSELDPYGNYGDKHTLSPYEMLMQMKAWNKEIYLTIENNDSEVRTQLSVLDGEIRAEITDVAQGLQTQIVANAEGVASKVSKTDYNGNTVASLIAQTPTAITAMAAALNLSGYVTFSSLTASGTTSIDGARIQTGFISADRLQASTILAKVIAAGGISADNITSGTISAARLSANTISSVLINAGGIDASMITAGTISSERLSAYAIRTLFLQAGNISADYISGGSLTGVTLNVNTDATIGNNLYLNPYGYGTKSIIFDGTARINSNGYTLDISAPSVNIGESTSFRGSVSFANATVSNLNATTVSNYSFGSTVAGKLDVYRFGSKVGTITMD